MTSPPRSRRPLACIALLIATTLASPLQAAASDAGAASAPDSLATSAHTRFGSGTPHRLLHKALERLPPLARAGQRRALAVITDFSDRRLEDWAGPGFNSEAEVRTQLDAMEAHWEWMSHEREDMDWDIVRITLPVALAPDAYASWPQFRDAVASRLRQQVDVARYDADGDGVIDSAWAITASGNAEYDWLVGGASRNAGVNLFVDGQGSLSVVVGATGNFNHEVDHTLGLPDLYGPNDTLHYLTLMSDSWPVPPNDFSAYERSRLGWLRPRSLGIGQHSVRLRNASEHFDAVRIASGRPGEYFLLEYRRRPDSGFGSSAPWHNGIAVYHVLESASQANDPPLVRLEAADGAIALGEAPQFVDFLYPGNAYQRSPLWLTPYGARLPVAALDRVEWEGNALRLRIRVLPRVPLRS